MDEQLSFWKYLVLFRRRLNKECSVWARDNIGWSLVLSVAPLAAGWLIQRRSIDVRTLVPTFWIYGITILGYAAAYSARTTWLLYREAVSDLRHTNEQLQDMEIQLKGFLEKSGSLQGKARELANDLFAFLREKGPEPLAQYDESFSFDERTAAIVHASFDPYHEKVRLGYEHKFRRRVIDFFNEMGECGIASVELQPSEIHPRRDRTMSISANLQRIFT